MPSPDVGDTMRNDNTSFAQSTDASISGVVFDPSGKVIPDADIEILNEATGLHYSGKTNGAGIYTVSILPPGQYCVQALEAQDSKTIIKPGHHPERAKRSGIELHAADWSCLRDRDRRLRQYR